VAGVSKHSKLWILQVTRLKIMSSEQHQNCHHQTSTAEIFRLLRTGLPKHS